jgi:single-strand DNA-binding protein
MSKGTKAIAILIGRMGDEVKVRQGGGHDIGSLRLACTSGYGDKETTSWFDVVVFDDKKVKVLKDYTRKGSRVMVSGELRVRKWQDKDGNDRYTTEVVVSFDGSIELLDSKAETEAAGGSTRNQSSRPQQEQRAAPAGFGDDLDDDVPF